MVIARTLVRYVGLASEWAGRIFCFLNLALVLCISFEVFMRYVFNSPTKWSYDITYMLGGAFILFSIPYVSLHRGHVSVDVVRRLMPEKVGLAVDVILHILLFFPLLIVLTSMGTQHAITSITQGELSSVGFWRPPLYPFRTIIPIAFALVLLQGVANFIVDICRLSGNWGDK